MAHTRAFVRQPAPNLADGLTGSDEGPPDIGLALEQHRGYCRTLEECGLELTALPADPSYPDSTFIEDTALTTSQGAIALRPGAPSRVGEVDSVVAALRSDFREIAQIYAPGTVDGGDVCEVDGHFLIGLSSRTNDQGARQLVRLLADMQFTSSILDIRGTRLLHLKSGLAYVSSGCIAITHELAREPALDRFEKIPVLAEERYAANCVRINDYVLVAVGYPKFAELLAAKHYHVVPVEMSEFRKMDGGLSCLSLRF